MNEREYALMRRVEDSYWWYTVLRDSVAAEVKARLAGVTGARILDAGCGTGGMMEALRRADDTWNISGLDFSPEAVSHTRQRGFDDVAQGSVNALPYANGTFDAVVSLDVLYFDGVDDALALSEMKRVLKPGGVLVLNLPAYDILRGEHDAAVSGVRRYTPMGVRKLLEGCSMEVSRLHCWNLWLFAPILAWRLLSRVRLGKSPAPARSDLFMPPHLINQALTLMGRLDMAVCRGIHSPLGTSVQAVANRREP